MGPMDGTELVGKIEALERRLEEQAVELSRLQARVEAPTPSVPPADSTTDRRGFVRAAAAAATGAVVGGAALLADATPAAAADGNAIIIGSSINTGTLATGMAVSGDQAAYGFGVTDNGLSFLPYFPGVFGHAKGQNFFIGLLGFAQGNSIGVLGVADAGTGVNATSNSGLALVASSGSSVGATVSGGAAGLRFGTNVKPAPPNRSDVHSIGEVDNDINGDLWTCVVTGTPGTWRKLAGPNTAGSLHVLSSSKRVYDSRPGFDPVGVTKGTLPANTERVVDCKLGSAVPAGAVAVLANITIISASGVGFLAAFKNGIAWPGTSTINWDHFGQVTANSAVVALDGAAQFRVRASDPVNYLVDVIGYYR